MNILKRARPLGGGGTPWNDVTDAQLRHWTGDFGGIRIPELAPRGTEDPVTGIRSYGIRNGRIIPAFGIQQGAIFVNHYGNYTESQRKLIRAEYCSRGYTHFPINISDHPTARGYSQVYPPSPSTAENVNLWLKELWWDGLIPCCVGIGVNDEEGYPAAKALAERIEPGLVKIIIPGLESDQDFPADRRDLLAARFLNVRRAFPEALLYGWFSPWHAAGDTPEPEWYGRGWARGQRFELPEYENGEQTGTYIKTMTYDWPGGMFLKLDGMVLQTDSFNDYVKALRHVEDQIIRLGGIRGKGYGGYWGRVETDLIYGEGLVMKQFWDGMPEAESVRYSDNILNTTYHQVYPGTADRPFQGRLAGFCNGGTPLTTSPIV